MRTVYSLPLILALFKWSMSQAYAFPSPSTPSVTAAALHRHQGSFRDIHLDSRQIRNADYSSNNPSLPGADTKPKPETTPKHPRPTTSPSGSSAPQPAESEDGQVKAARSVRVDKRRVDLPLFIDARVVEDMTSGAWKRNVNNGGAVHKPRRHVAPGEPVDTAPATSDVESRGSYITRAPRKIDGGWWKKRQEAIYNINHSPSPFDDVARAPKPSRAERENRQGRGTLPHRSTTVKHPIVPRVETKPTGGALQELEAGRQVENRSTQRVERDAKFMDAWNKLANPQTTE